VVLFPAAETRGELQLQPIFQLCRFGVVRIELQLHFLTTETHGRTRHCLRGRQRAPHAIPVHDEIKK